MFDPGRRSIPRFRLKSLFRSGLALVAILSSNWGPVVREARSQASSAPSGFQVLSEIPYVSQAQGKVSRRQTLDLYLPRAGLTKPPLVVFIHGGYWMISDDDFRIGRAFAEQLVERGIAVGLVRYRLAPSHRHPAQVRDVAAGIVFLLNGADRYGYDSKRIYIAGHSAGAHLAALIALDSSHLAAHGARPSSLAGVIAISGIYDLTRDADVSREHKAAVEKTFGREAATLTAASPMHRVRRDAPPFLIVSGSSDFTGFSTDALRFGEALQQKGRQQAVPLVVSGNDHFAMARLSGPENSVRELILDFVRVEPAPPHLKELIEAKRQWLKAPFSTLPFWRHKDLIRSYPLDNRVLARLVAVYGPLKHELVQWPLREFHAIDLFSYLDALPPEKVGRGDYLVLTNIRNEKQFWSRQQIAPYKPVIVVGIDGQRDLFQMSIFTRMPREYSWKTGPVPPSTARPVGAFIHFMEPPPPELSPRSWHHALTEGGFRLEENDALAHFKELPKDVYEALTFRNGCIYCHNLQGIGSRSHHTQISKGAPHGGFALPLEKYPPEVWKAFIFNQEEVAEKMGATPNMVEESAREYLYDLVVKSRGNPTSR